MVRKGKKNKRTESSAEENSFTSGATSENQTLTRDRSRSKRRKTMELLDQQNKITQYTRQPDAHRSRSGSDGDDVRGEGTDGYPNIPVSVILSKLDMMDQNITASKDEYRQMDQKLEKILYESFEIRKENSMLKKQIETLTKHIKDTSEEVERLEKKLREEKEIRNNLEQYTRKDNIKIINLQGDRERETAEETEKSVLNFFHTQMGLTSVTAEQISIAHRVGPYRRAQNRPIIIKFISRKTKVLIMKNRKILKNKKPQIYINEDLTKLNSQRLSQLKKHIGVLSAWSFEGSLYCKLLSLEVRKIENGDLGLIDRALINTPSRHLFSQRKSDTRGGRGSQPTFIGSAVQEARGGVRSGPAGHSSTVQRDAQAQPSTSSPADRRSPGGEQRQRGTRPAVVADPLQDSMLMDQEASTDVPCDPLQSSACSDLGAAACDQTPVPEGKSPLVGDTSAETPSPETVDKKYPDSTPGPKVPEYV